MTRIAKFVLVENTTTDPNSVNSLPYSYCLFFVWVNAASAQSISGQVQESDGKPIPFANVLLISARDSAFVKGTVATDAGRFVLEPVSTGTYRVTVSAIGYRKMDTDLITLSAAQSSRQLDPIVLPAESGQLAEIIVKTSRPLYEQQMDKLVVNVQAMLTATGGNALDVLERSPGVVLNRQNNALSLAGKSGVVIMINGKINRLPMETVLQMLSGVNAATIDRVELIMNPSARYDADGDAGIINIILKKDASAGLNGSYHLTAGFGWYEKLNGGVSLNYRRQKLNIFADYSAVRDREWQQLRFYSDLRIDGKFTQNRTVKDAFNTRPFQNARLGFDYSLTTRTLVGGLLNGFLNTFRSHSPAHQTIHQSGQLTEQVHVLDVERNRWQYGMANLNLTHRFRQNQVLTVDLDYVRYGNQNPHDYTNQYQSVQYNRDSTEWLRTRKETPIRIWVVKGGYTMDLNPKTTLELGAKTTVMRLNNDVRVAYYRQDRWQTDTAFSRQYGLSDNITAGYANLNYTLSPTNRFQAGLRYEYTDTKIGQPAQAPIVERRYGSWFPSVFFTHDFSKTSSIQGSYSRRIQRPGYDLLAPWVLFVNPYSFVSGNPRLMPTFTNAVQATYRFRSSYLLTLKFSHDRNALDRFRVRIDSTTNRTFITPENIRSLNTLSLLFSFPVTVTKWWKMQANLTGVGQQLAAITEGKPIALQLFNANVFTTHTFTLPGGFTGEINTSYNSAAFWGISRIGALGSVNLGLKKKLPKKGGTVVVNVSDLFWTNKLNLTTNNAAVGQISGWSQRFEPRVVRLTYTNTFGNRQMKAANHRATGSEEERSRVSTN